MHVSWKGCLKGKFKVIEVTSERSGIFCSLKAICEQCGYFGYLDSTKRQGACFREGAKLNTALCLAANVVGLDFNGMERLCHIMGLDGPSDSWDTLYNTKLHEVLSRMTDDLLADNRRRSHEHRGSDGTVPT